MTREQAIKQLESLRAHCDSMFDDKWSEHEVWSRDVLAIDIAIATIAAIEDILGDEYDFDRLRELVQADREGRCVVLKFAPGSTVYRAWFNPSNGKLFVAEHIMKSKEMCLEAELWNDAYKTKEEAEKALEEMKGNGNG